MPDFCVAYGCSNERTKKTKDKGITFHRFPRDVERRQAWTLALRRDRFEPNQRSLLCSCHFRPEDFDRTGQTVRLRDGVIPSIFNFPEHLSKLPSSRSSRTSKKAGEQCPQPHTPASEPDLFEPSDTDHPYALDPVKTKQKLTESQDQVEKLRRELRNARDRERRQKKTVRSLLEDLKEKNMMTEELQEKLDFYSDLPVELLKREHAFTPRQKEFALTLHMHGPKAYSYLRETMKIPLPHPHTLLKWLQTVDAKPGLNTSLLNMLQRRKNEDPDSYGQVCLVLDGMAIRKQVQYNSHTRTMRGFVDLGMGIDETTMAKEALVFMVVGLKGHWKLPIAFYFINSVAPDTQKILLLHALEALHERGIKVVCVTMDGHISNITMCTMLGCQLKLNQPLKTYFSHPSSGENVYVIMDPCHMLKLARNMLEAYSCITSPAGTVKWQHISKLNNVQEREGLHAANKVTRKHVNFGGQKLKVSVAAQTLSRSVALALTMLKEAGYPQFEDSSPTAEFVQVIDRLFDMMNSRNPRAPGFKAPLGVRNWEEKLGFMTEARGYLTSLLMNDGTPLYLSKRYLSVTGFVINIESFTMMIPELLERQQYVCTYRFSQDHLELFFNSIRASGGWNNNPSVVNFQHYFRRVMVRCGIAPGDSGNVQAQDDTVCLSAIDMSSVVPAQDDDNVPTSPSDRVTGIVLDHSYLPTSFGALTENALVYIAGFVVRQVMKKLTCDVCRSSLVSAAVPTSLGGNYHLLTLRNNGGLLVPSEGTVKVIRLAEQCIRRVSNISSAAHQCSESLLNRVVKAELGSEDVFHFSDHSVETQDGIDNHHFDLISLILSSFHKLRQHHVAKVHTLQLQSSSLRKKLCKVVLLQGY